MIPLLRPIVPNAKAAERYFREARKSGIYSNFGRLHDELEARFERLTGASNVLPVVSGTAAIEVALRVSELKPGARVLVPDFTHSGTLIAVVRAGMTPVLAGVDPKTWTLDPVEVANWHAHGLIDAAVVVSPFGYQVDFETWEQVSVSEGLPLVYDLAGAFGEFPALRGPACYSFHATKNFGVGEGGMVVFNDSEQYMQARRLINFDTLPSRNVGSLAGSNQKMCEILCAHLLAALDEPHLGRVVKRIEAKRTLLRFYQEMLKVAFVPAGEKWPSLCVLGGLPAQDLEDASEELGVTFKRYYPLLSRMPALAEVARLSESGDDMATCCALPCDVTMGEAFEVVDAVRGWMEGRR